ncbi:MAG: MaoC family dehydratase [Candidatus Sericytochromatia bacterium]
MNFEIGQEHKEEVSFSFEDVKKYAELSGDKNPIHIDPEYAKNTPFGRCIVHGMFASSKFSKVLATSFPGEGTVYLEQNLEFKKPIFPDEKYNLIMTIAEKKVTSSGKTIYKIETKIVDLANNICVNGKATVII